MLTRRTILLTAACSVAVCLSTSRFATAGPTAADDASALAFVSAIYNSYKPDSDGVRSTAAANYAAISSRCSLKR